VNRLSGVVWVDDTHAFVNLGPSWFAWNPTQTTLGSAVAGFPMAPFYDGAGHVVGLAMNADAGVVWSVVSLDVTSSQLSTVGTNVFSSVTPTSSFGVSSALLE
jgi:hypothetical protein